MSARDWEVRLVGLRGRLEDMSLVDILQIVAFSQKTGNLQVETPGGNGAVAFERGNVICAYSWSTLKYLKRIAQKDATGPPEAAVIREQINMSLRELARLREGEFHFELAESLPAELAGVDISSFLSFGGVNPQHLLLDLSKDMDEQRRDAATMLEAMFDGADGRFDLLDDPDLDEGDVTDPPSETASESPPHRPCRIVLVDDDPNFVESLTAKIRDDGYQARCASGPTEGERLVASAQDAGAVVAVVDQKMPTSSRRSFNGGFELARRLRKRNVPVLLMADGFSDADRKRALSLGIRKVVYKPTLSQLDPEEYNADFARFVGAILERLAEMTADMSRVETAAQRPVEASESLGSEDGRLEFVASMTEKLLDRNRSSDISHMVLAVAARFFQRGVLFLVDRDQACGLSAFGLRSSENDSFAVARKLRLALTDVEPFSLVVKRRRTHRAPLPDEQLETALLNHIGRNRANESVLVPMLHNGEVLLILYGDNGTDGGPVGGLRELELFVAQAGMALENAFMQHKLENLDTRLAAKA